MRSFGLIATCSLKTSAVQSVHHAGVAVELGLLLNKKKLVLPRLLYNITTSNNLAEYNTILFVIENESKNLHYTV